MLTVDEARSQILEGLDPLETIEVPLAEALGSAVAHDLYAPHPLPRFDNSAMDGYAVRRADVVGASTESPIALALTGEVRAGDNGNVPVAAGTCVRIMTGAMVPPDADAIVPVEDTEERDDKVWISVAPSERAHIRPSGDDIEQGAFVLGTGSEIGPGEAALLASLGLSPLRVHRSPRVALIATGDELVAPEEEPGPGRIRDSNTIALRALVEENRAEPIVFRSVADDLNAVVAALEAAAEVGDLIVSGGGVSVGRYDYVKEAVEKLGAIDLWRVAMQPGKPVVLGNVKGTPFLGLPGNPVSVHIGFEQFVRPAIRKLRGCNALLRPVVRAVLTEDLAKRPGRLHFVRVALSVEGDGFKARPIAGQGSHIQSSLIGCHGVARFSIEESKLAAGSVVEVEVWRLPDAESAGGGR